MTKKNITIRLACLVIIILSVPACMLTQQAKDDTPAIDSFELERLAAAAYESRDLVESEKHYTTLIKNIPQEPLLWFRLANIYAWTKRPDDAIAAYREVLVRDPKYIKAWFNMGVIQLRQAANSFNEMQIYSDPADPLYGQGKEVFEAIVNLIKGDEPAQ